MANDLKYVYTTIPIEYVCVYHKILELMSELGEGMLKDCKFACKDRSTNILDCYNMFNTAVAALRLGEDKKAETIIKYIKAVLKQIQPSSEEEDFIFYIGPNNSIKAHIHCDIDGNITILDMPSDKVYYYEYNDVKYIVYVPGIINPYTGKVFVNVANAGEDETNVLIYNSDGSISEESEELTPEDIVSNLRELGFDAELNSTYYYNDDDELMLSTPNRDYHSPEPMLEVNLYDFTDKIPNINTLLNS